MAVNTDDPKGAPVVRYTLAQRQRDLRVRQYADECRRTKPAGVTDSEEQLSTLCSKAPHLEAYVRFSTRRRALFCERAEFRKRRCKARIKAQKSEA